MKAETQLRIGLWGAIAFIALRISQIVRFWAAFSPQYMMGLILSTIIFSIYIFGIVSKKLKVTQWIYRAWWVFVSINLISLFIKSLESGKWSGSFENALITLRTFLILGVLFGILTLILWEGLRGLERIVGTEKKLDDEKKEEKPKDEQKQ